jgi:hypothetical protein
MGICPDAGAKESITLSIAILLAIATLQLQQRSEFVGPHSG